MSTGVDRRTAILDACVLVPIRLTATLLWLAEAGLFGVLWSDTILDEVQRNLPKLGVSAEKAARRVRTMRRAFGAAALVDDFAHLIPEMTCDAKDRHVLAAAVRGGADTLVTFNLKDFPAESTAGRGIEVVHPDEFLVSLLAQYPDEAVTALSRGVAELQRPTQTVREFLASLTPTMPTFANLAAEAVTSPTGPVSPVPALVTADDEEALAAFGESGDWTNPAHVAISWWTGILHDLNLARTLTLDPTAWGDYQPTIGLLAGKSLASKVIPAVDAPRHVAFIRFVPEVATSAQVFSTYATSVTVLVLVRIEDDTWRVWGVGGRMPAAGEVLEPGV